jgi:molybdopterin-binding protein
LLERLADLPANAKVSFHHGSGDRHMKISARNQLRGKIVSITKGATTAHVLLDIGGTMITASITNQAVDELNLKEGTTAYAVVKASDVMVAVEE